MDILSNRLILKEISWEDLEDIHKLHSFPEVDEFNTIGIPNNVEETKELIRPLIEGQANFPIKSFTWKIVTKDLNDFIGMAGMNLSCDKFKSGEIYYKLLPQHWGKGYATEISRILVKFGFENLHLHKIEAGVATENIKSIRVLEKSGMTREGLRRKILPIRGEWKDSYHYAIVEDDSRDYY
jgi:[ribosomal protein S5]-alanine N-acetyltransferase